MTTAEQVHPLDPRLSRRDLGIVDDLVAHVLEQVRAGRSLTWDEAVAYVRAHPAVSVSGDNAPTVAVVAVNRLEETGEVVYDRANGLRQRRDDDPTFAADRSTIERAVVDHMSTGHNSSVWKLYAEVFRGRYVHRDVYYACRALLAAGLLAKPHAQGGDREEPRSAGVELREPGLQGSPASTNSPRTGLTAFRTGRGPGLSMCWQLPLPVQEFLTRRVKDPILWPVQQAALEQRKTVADLDGVVGEKAEPVERAFSATSGDLHFRGSD